MVQLYQNATPDMKFTGYKDTPKPGAQGGGVVTPLFCPLTPIVAAWGSTEDAFLIAGDEFESIFGSDTWDVHGKYFNHSNLFAKMFQQKAIRHFLMRMELPGMRKAAGRLSIEFVKHDVPQFERGTDGKFKLDVDGAKIPATPETIPGYKIRFSFDKADEAFVKGTGGESEGTLVGNDGEKSRIIPLADFEGTFFGTRGNRFNFNIHQPKVNSEVPVDKATIESMGNMLYRFSVTETPVNGGTSIPWYTRLANESMDFTFASNALNKSGARINFLENYKKQFTLSNQSYNGANVTGPVDGMFVYQKNIELVLGLLHASETDVGVDSAAFTDMENIHSINLFGDTDHRGVPYSTILLAGTSELEPTTYIPGTTATFKLGGGNDGDMSLEKFEEAVGVMIDTFGNGITLNDMKRYPWHFIFDSGYGINVKKKLQSLKAKRPDIYVGIGTHIHGTEPKPLLDELAMGSSLAANAGLYPESTIYKTESTRGHILPWCIRIAETDPNSEWTYPTTLNYDLAGKMAEYWGSSDQVWVVDKAFDTYPNNVIKHEILNHRYAALPVREEMWGNQLIAVEYSDVNELIYSGLQTVNPNDSSVLNSIVAVGGTIHTTWACIRANSHFVGRNMAASVLIQDSNELIVEFTKGIDKSKVTVVPDTQITPEDNDAGYAWTTVADTLSGGMRTVNTISVTSGYFEE